MPQHPEIGADVSALMGGGGNAPQVGEDVSHLMTEPAKTPSGGRRFMTGAKDEVVRQAQGVDLLMDTSRDVIKKVNPLGVLSDGVSLARGGKPDENVALQTMRGFGQGAWQGVKDLIHHPVESLDPTGAVAVAKSKDDNWTKAGHGSVLAAESLLPFLRPLKRIRGLRAAAAEAEAAQAEMRSVAAGLTPGPTDAVVAHGLGGPKAPPQGVPGGRLTKIPAPRIEQSIADALAETRKPTPAPGVELPPPAQQPRVTYPRTLPTIEPPQMGGRLTGARAPTTAEIIASALEEARKPTPAPSVELPPPPFSNGSPTPPAQPRVTVTAPRTKAPGKPPTAPPAKGLAPPPGREGHFTLPEKIATDAEFELARKEAGFGPSTSEIDRRAAGGTLQPGQAERRGVKTPEQVHGTSEAPVAVDPNLGPDAFTTVPEDLLNRPDVAEGRAWLDSHPEAPVTPQFDKPLTAAEVAQEVAKRTGKTPRTITGVSRVTPKPGVVADARHALGADRAAGHLEKLGVKMSPDEIRTAEGGPSRQPYAKLDAENDIAYRRRLSDERGGINPRLAMTMGGAAAGGAGFAAMADDDHKVGAGVVGALTGAAAMNPMATLRGMQKLRVMGMLSGAALPKSVAGNIGAIGTAAVENHSLTPIKEALRLPTNARAAMAGWKNNANPQHVSGISRLNVPARAMGALDQATTQVLQRSGLTLPEAQRLLLTNPDTLGAGNLGRAMKGDVGKAAFPFQNTPVNGVAEGIKSLDGMLGTGAIKGEPPHTITKRLLTAGTVGAGAAAGSTTDDPRTLALLAALMGPRGIPFALGAGVIAGPRVMSNIGVGLPDGAWKDFVSPEGLVRPFTDPSIVRFLAWLRGEKPATP